LRKKGWITKIQLGETKYGFRKRTRNQGGVVAELIKKDLLLHKMPVQLALGARAEEGVYEGKVGS